jgi:hypothetical protein
MLTASRITSLGVGFVMICVALLFAQGATGIFTLLFILESMFLIPLGLPLLYGFIAKGGPWWSGRLRLHCRRNHFAGRKSLPKPIPGHEPERDLPDRYSRDNSLR